MVRPEKVVHAKIFLSKDKVNNLIKVLHDKGICQVHESTVDLDSVYTYEEAKDAEDTHTRLSAILNHLEDYKEVPQPEKLLKSLISPKKPVKLKSLPADVEQATNIAKEILSELEEDVTAKVGEIKEINEKINQNMFIRSNLEKLPDMKTSLFESTEMIKCNLGIVRNTSLSKLQDKLKEIALVGEHTLDKNESVVAVYSAYDKSAEVDKIVHGAGFEVLTVPFEHKTPMQIIEKIKTENDKFTGQVIKVKKELENVQRKYDERLAIAAEEMDIVRDKLDALKSIKAGHALTIMEVWVPAKELDEFEKVMNDHVKDYYYTVSEREEAPTKYNNHKWVKPFELITDLYSRPKYKGIDPTIFIAIFFSIFFGLMLTDFFYGIILSVFALLMIRGGKYNDALRNFGVIFLFFGISTTLWGVVFGSYFGDFFQKIGVQLPMLIDPLKDVMISLGIAIGLGTLHLVVGLVVGFYDHVRGGKIKDALAKQGVWLLFLAAVAMFIVQKMSIAYVLLGLSVGMQLFFNFLEGGIVTAVLSIFGFTGFLGDLFSYARLMALGIGTSGISLAVNFMVLLSADLIPVIGIVVAALVFIAGHLFNMGMNGLGAFIHSTRLHFLEFFTKFYEGGGHAYKPFKAERKRTMI